MCQLCGNPFANHGNQLSGLGDPSLLQNAFARQQTPTMSIEDAKFILMEVGCNNLLGTFDTQLEAQKHAEKLCKKQIKKLHIFKLESTIESVNKVLLNGTAI